jgi:probable F420-dependent oxidoreductase
MLRNYLEGLDRAGTMLSIGPQGGQTSAGDQIQRVGSGETTSHGTRIPRLIAGNGPRMMELSKTHADGLIPVNSPDEQTTLARFAIGPDKFLLAGATVIMEADPIKARSVGRHHIAGRLALPNYAENVRRFGFSDDDVKNGGSDRLVDALVAWGDVDSICARLESLFDKGADHVSIGMVPTHGIHLDEWRRLAEVLNS